MATKRKNENFITKHINKIAIILLVLFMFKSFQSCLRKTEIVSTKKKLIEFNDSIKTNLMIDLNKKDSVLNILKDSIARYQYELKIAGVKVNEASKRADAIQKTAEKIKTNTTIKIEADTSRTKIK